MSGINQLFGPSRVQGIEPVEQRRKADSVFAPLGELAAGGRAVALIRASRLEWVAATRTHDAYTKRAHAFWRLGNRVRQGSVGRKRLSHADTT
jgi:hypothetical protein